VVTKGRHPKNPINEAFGNLDSSKFQVVEIHSGHIWGRVVCLTCKEHQTIYSTPRVPESNAKAIARFVARHIH